MKKLVLTLAIMAMAAITVIAQEQKFVMPAKDASLAVLQQQLALAPGDYYKISISYRIDFLQNGEPTTFSDACARIDTAINAVNPSYYDYEKLNLKKQYGFFDGKFMPELLAYCQANPSSYDFHIAIIDKTEWGFQTVSDCLLKYPYPASYVLKAVDYLNRQAIALGKTDAEVLDLLKKLNRIFSARLIEDKDAWGGVVAKIRTMMETYK